MRKELYQKRVKANVCVSCCAPLGESYDRRKCKVCLAKDNAYRKNNRTQKVVESERKYRQKVWYKRCVWKSTRKDRIKNRVSSKPTINPTRLRTLRVLQQNKCFYCEKEMQVKNRQKHDGLTIERLDNSKPHTTDNVVLCCSRCNCKRLSDKHEIDIAKAFDLILSRFEKSPAYTRFIEEFTPSEQTESENSEKTADEMNCIEI